jgi:hypothetical protein
MHAEPGGPSGVNNIIIEPVTVAGAVQPDERVSSKYLHSQLGSRSPHVAAIKVMTDVQKLFDQLLRTLA